MDNIKLPEGWLDWNTLTLDQMVQHLERKYQFDSSGDAKCIYHLIEFYKDHKKKTDRIYISLYNEDSFCGLSVPMELEKPILFLKDNTTDVIDEVFYNYDDYKNYEVEMSSYSKDGSNGTKYIEDMQELYNFFEKDGHIRKVLKNYNLL